MKETRAIACCVSLAICAVLPLTASAGQGGFDGLLDAYGHDRHHTEYRYHAHANGVATLHAGHDRSFAGHHQVSWTRVDGDSEYQGSARSYTAPARTSRRLIVVADELNRNRSAHATTDRKAPRSPVASAGNTAYSKIRIGNRLLIVRVAGDTLTNLAAATRE